MASRASAARRAPSRYSDKRSIEWQPLRPELVCEVRYDHFSGARFRHGSKFLRWWPASKACTLDPVTQRGTQGALGAFSLR